MKQKKILIAASSGMAIALLVVSTLASAANLGQAASTLPANEEWSIMARAALNQPSGHDYLRTPINGNVATDYEKRILAITSQGLNPRTHSSENFVAKLESMFDGTQIGETFLLNDDIFGILALKSASGSASAVSGARQFILSNQNSDGGWGYAPGVASDSNSTAMAIAALSLTGSVPQNAYSYLDTAKASGSGYAYQPGQPADGASTAWVMAGLHTAGRSVPNDARNFLDGLQLSNGSFKWMPSDAAGSSLVTAYAVIALSDKGIPVDPITNPTPPPPPPVNPPPGPNPPPPPPANQTNNANCVNMVVPSSVTPGQSFFALVTMNNSGGKTWDSSQHKLGSQNPQDNVFWGTSRVALPVSSVTAGNNVTFSFNPVAPASTGTYVFSWKMVEEGVEWFGTTCSVSVIVANAPTPPPPPVNPPPPPPPVNPPPPFPPPPPPPSGASYYVSISYPGNKIYVGNVNFNPSGFVSKTGQNFSTSTPTAMQALVTAMDEINLLYEISPTSFGPFVKTVNGYKPAGLNGWLYSVNGTSPQVGAHDYLIRSGDRIQWYYGGSDTQPYQ